MKNYKKISYLFMSSVLLSSAIMPTTITNAEESDVKKFNKGKVGLEQGDFLLKTNEPIGFGSHQIENKKKTVTTGFEDDFGIVDARGTQEGWSVTVSASPFTIIEPETGWIEENPYQLPAGSLSLASLSKVEGVNEEPEKFHPKIDKVDTAIDLNEAISVATADKEKGMGEYALNYNKDALSLVIDPLTAKIDTVNYPNTLTPYESNVTWNLISGPSLDNGNDGEIEGDNSGGSNNSGGNDESQIKKLELSFSDFNGDKIIELKDMKEITKFETDNDIEVEIISVEEGKVRVKVISGTPSSQKLVSGEYVPSSTKEVTNQETAEYTDSDGFSGTLEKYVASGENAKTKTVTNQESANYSDTDGYKGTLTQYLHEGEDVKTKKVTNQDAENYSDAEGYKGTLTKYLASGEVSKTKEVTNQDSANYSDKDGFSGTLEKYVASGEDVKTKTVTNQESANYSDAEGYKGTLTQYLASGEASKVKTVTNQESESYSDAEGYKGTLTRYLASGEDVKTKAVTNQVSADYSDGEGYTGTLTRYLASGEDVKSKFVTAQTSANYSDTEGYTGTLNQYVYSGAAPVTKYVSGQTSSWYNDGSYSGTLTQYVSGGSAPQTKYLEGRISGGISHLKQTFGAGYAYPYNDGTFSGNLYIQSESHIYHPSGVTLNFTYDQYSTSSTDTSLQNLDWATIKTSLEKDNPSIKNINVVSMNWSTGIQSGSFVSDGKPYQYKRSAVGTVTADGWEVVADIGGNVTSKDTRTYAYAGYVNTQDTRVYRYQGNVSTQDTRIYRYQGNVSTPDTRVYKYQGTVSTPDTRVFRYQGDVKTEDTRVYKYKGNVSTPDTRVYKYEGDVSTEDTRVFRYQGDVSTEDTRVYRYGGIVTKEEVDTRVFQNLYDFNLKIEYK